MLRKCKDVQRCRALPWTCRAEASMLCVDPTVFERCQISTRRYRHVPKSHGRPALTFIWGVLDCSDYGARNTINIICECCAPLLPADVLISLVYKAVYGESIYLRYVALPWSDILLFIKENANTIQSTSCNPEDPVNFHVLCIWSAYYVYI